jgi:hypothetical protein
MMGVLSVPVFDVSATDVPVWGYQVVVTLSSALPHSLAHTFEKIFQFEIQRSERGMS